MFRHVAWDVNTSWVVVVQAVVVLRNARAEHPLALLTNTSITPQDPSPQTAGPMPPGLMEKKAAQPTGTVAVGQSEFAWLVQPLAPGAHMNTETLVAGGSGPPAVTVFPGPAGPVAPVGPVGP